MFECNQTIQYLWLIVKNQTYLAGDSLDQYELLCYWIRTFYAACKCHKEGIDPLLFKVAIGILLPITTFVIACAVSLALRTCTKEALLQISHFIFAHDTTHSQDFLQSIETAQATNT
jgi:hypothetical protein